MFGIVHLVTSAADQEGRRQDWGLVVESLPEAAPRGQISFAKSCASSSNACTFFGSAALH